MSPAKRLNFEEVPDWPKLAWAAAVTRGSTSVSVLHGPCVETNPGWCAEAVWAGKFADGDFDSNDLVIGTGIRARPDGVLFVSSGDSMNRLHYYDDDGTIHVSNSLPALMAVADLSLLADFDYFSVMRTVIDGYDRYVTEVPTTRDAVHLVYFDNLLVTDTGVSKIRKTFAAPDFADFAAYRDYLTATARRLGENARAPERRHRITPLATVSRGYDSPAAAVIAREAGARQAVTIDKARRHPGHLVGVHDSGADVARQLGLDCKVYRRGRRNYPHEDAVWAGVGNVGDLNFTIFDYPQPLCLLFTGQKGDGVWNRNRTRDRKGFLVRGDTSGNRFSECRLELGVFNCAPAYWTTGNEERVVAINRSPEMAPWTLGTGYDRPIARRLVEEAGVRRGSFATKKRVTSFNRLFGVPLSADLRDDFAAFMERNGGRAVSGPQQALSQFLRAADALVFRRLPPWLDIGCRNWIRLPSPSMFFIWANERRKRRYLAGLEGKDKGDEPAKDAASGAG